MISCLCKVKSRYDNMQVCGQISYDNMQVCGQILYDIMHAYGQSLYNTIMHVLRPNPLMIPCMFGANPFCGIVHVLGSTCSHSIPTMLTRFYSSENTIWGRIDKHENDAKNLI